jgi:outer membrane receptor for ferrienterochelin and colicins
MTTSFSSPPGGKLSLCLQKWIAGLALAFLPALMHGQAVDYGALEQLFKEPVTTSVNGSPQRVSDVPATMIIITAEDIRRTGAKDIAGVLREVGGIDTLEWGNDNIDVSVRGYDQAEAARLLVLVDGRQVYQDDYGYTPWNSIPVELGMIRQIEVIKGPNTALFGFNAAGGVINIITYNPLYDDVNLLSTTGGTQALAAGSYVETVHLGKSAAVRLSAGGDSNNDFSTPIPASEATTSRRHQYRDAADFDIVFRLHGSMLLNFEATHSDAKLNEMQPSYQLGNALHGTDSVKVQFSNESRLGLFQATVYNNWSRDAVNLGTIGAILNLNERLTVVQVQNIFKLGSHHTLRAAIDYRYAVENTTPTTGANVQNSTIAASGMWNWTITPKLSLTNALRFDRLAIGRDGYTPPGFPFTNTDWQQTFKPISFNSGLVWKPNDVDSLRVMAGRGNELPGLVENGALLLNLVGYNITGTPFLKPTEVINFETGWDHALSAPHLVFRGSTFYQQSEDIRAYTGGLVQTTAGLYNLPLNIGSSDAYGVELGVKGGFLRDYRWSVDYRPEWIRDHFIPSAQNGADFTDYQRTTPVNLVKANLGWATKVWEVDSYLHYQSSSAGIQVLGIGGGILPVARFTSMDARIAYKSPGRLTWSVSGQNLTHGSQHQTVGPAVERRVLGTLSFTF